MITLKSYIQEGLNKKDIFDNIDPTKFEWKRYYSDEDYLAKCKEDVYAIAKELYPEASHWSLEPLYKDTYKLYCKTNPKAKDKDIDELYERNLKLIKKYGFNTFVSLVLEQGWWVFIRWAYENSK
jgi:hypothetical protein